MLVSQALVILQHYKISSMYLNVYALYVGLSLNVRYKSICNNSNNNNLLY